MKAKEKSESKYYGCQAEQYAAEYLLLNGYIIRERNWHPRNSHLEVDIIAQKGMVIVFVEVKARSGNFMDPADAVDEKKMKNMIRAARIYLSSVHEDYEYRFDIITVTPVNPTLDTDKAPTRTPDRDNSSPGFGERFAPKLPPPTLITDTYTLDHLPDAFLPPLH